MILRNRRQIQKENRIIAVLLAMLLISLIIVSYAFSVSSGYSGSSGPSFGSFFRLSGETSAGNAVIPTHDDIGKTVYVEGNILDFRKTNTGDHLIITLLCSGGSEQETISVFIRKSSGAANVSARIVKGAKIGVTGTVQEYSGSLEIVVSKEQDITILSRKKKIFHEAVTKRSQNIAKRSRNDHKILRNDRETITKIVFYTSIRIIPLKTDLNNVRLLNDDGRQASS